MGDRIDTDAQLHRALVSNQLEDAEHPVELEGSLYRTERAAQNHERSLAEFLLEHFVDEKISHVPLHAVEEVGGS
jgi:hypothetical protein